MRASNLRPNLNGEKDFSMLSITTEDNKHYFLCGACIVAKVSSLGVTTLDSDTLKRGLIGEELAYFNKFMNTNYTYKDVKTLVKSGQFKTDILN